MKSKSGLWIYSCIWGIAIIILALSIFQNIGDARVVNYSGIVRGATQKLVKNELNGNPNDALIKRLDSILLELQTGDGKFGLTKFRNKKFQDELSDMSNLWGEIQSEIKSIRKGADPAKLYSMSEVYFEKADTMVRTAEEYSSRKLILMTSSIFIYLLCSLGYFYWWNRKKQMEIQIIKYQDKLTGIPNYTAFDYMVEKIIKTNPDEPYVLLCFDIDDFKFLNTSYGISFGDDLLKIIGSTLSSHIDKDEACARQGSDFFLLFVKNTNNIIETIKDALYTAVRKKAVLDISGDITFAFGACVHDPSSSIDSQTLIDNAHLSHKNAKQTGRGSVVWYNDELMLKLYHDNMIIKRMHKALADGEFQMFLQPKFEINTEKIVSAEALARWIIPNQGLISPDEFIPLFENNGFIYDLDCHMLRKACQYIKEQNLCSSHFTISVNVSRVTLYHKDFYEQLLGIMKSYDLPNSCIELEITESAFNGLDSSIISTLTNLQHAGFNISIDDFGTGYSSLGLLNSLPIDVLKIDRVFLKEL